MPAFIDLTGQTFTYLTVIKRAENRGLTTCWLCECKCGVLRIVSAGHLRSGHTQSCGCLQKEGVRQRALTHGKSKTPEYDIWINIQQRCTNPRHPYWGYYGGREITVEWKTFEEFFADVGPRPTPQHTVERKDNMGAYSAENCMWATRKEQSNNMRNNKLITYQKKTQTETQWAREKGIHRSTLVYRLRNGWSIERALMAPTQKKHEQENCELTIFYHSGNIRKN